MFRREGLAYTLARNRVDLLTITGPGPVKARPLVFITARVHPGETVSSLVMKGVIDFLLSDEPQAQHLRKHMVFKLVPMLNPDGVIHGNYRCNLSGHDLNRCWQAPNSEIHSEIYSLKKEILKDGNRVVLYCDLHGHSKKQNVFVYGCHFEANPFATRALPYLLSRISKNFNFHDCSF
jgi:murein tripeptide amidase MpaA